MNKKRILSATVMGLVTLAPFAVKTTSVIADGLQDNQTNAERADITNWVANSTEQIQSNMQEQNIDINNLNDTVYFVRWGDTLSGISEATGIAINKLAYDNHIENIDLIYAGQRLVLNKDGQVPTDYHYRGTGKTCAYSPIIINNYDFSDHSVNKQVINFNVSPVKEKVTEEAKEDKDQFKPNADNVDKAGLDGDAVRKAKQGLEKAQSDQSSATSTVSSSTTGASSSSEAKSSTSSKEASSSDKEAKSEELSEEDFKTAVEDAINDKLDTDSINFIDDKVETEKLDEDKAEDVFDTDETSKTTGKMTEETAKKLADEIVSALKDSDKYEDVINAEKVELSLTANGDAFDYNVSFEASDEESSEASSEDDVDSTSEDTDSEESNAVDTNDESEDEDY